MSFIIQLRRDTAANWTSRNPVLHSGELGVEIDTGKAKFGDGTTSWSTLSYWNPGSSLANPMTTIGDLIVAGTGGSPARLARGSSGQVLSVGPSGSVGWSTPTARVNAVTQFGATTSGDSTTAIQNALLSFGTLAGWNGTGGVVYLPPGDYATSRPLIIPAGVWLVGDGWSSIVDLTTGSDCDVIQFASYQSASQAAILGVSASAIGNAFYAGIADLQIHGDAFHTTVAGYRHGVSITLNPGTSIAPTDPEFDPLVAIRNVYIKGCTGDGINHSGRSGAYFERVYSAFHNGCAFAPSFDTTMVDCLAAFCNSGFYMNHGSNVGTGCKSYNHNDYTWVSGHSYAPNAFGGIHTMAIDNGQMYFCIAATSGTTAPHLDPSHWTAVSATAPQANGTGYYWDTNAGEQSWAACDSQENSTSNFYLKGPSNGGSGIIIQATSSEPNFNNGQPAFSAANPNNYSHVVFDGVQSATVHISTTGTAARNPVVCRSLNNPSNHVLTATTDGSESAVFVGGTPKYSMINGTIISNGNATFNGTLVTAHNTVDDGSGNATFNGTLATAHNTLDDGTGKSVFNGNVKVNGALDINAGGFSTTPLVSSADGTTSSHGALVHVIGGNGTESGHYLLWYDVTDPAYIGLSMALGVGLTYNGHAVIALGGYYNGWGVQGSTHDTGAAIFGVLKSNESGRTVTFRIDDNGTIVTKNNTLDDGSGNLSVGTAGSGLRVKEGSNAKQGTATLTGGTVTVANTSVTASSRIFLTAQDNNSTGALRVSARTAGTSFTITSSNAGDSGVVAYQIFEPA